ncbi:MAG: hypothetical protein OIN88_15840 [Candidatus Methanoperedens sp.]|nr:hypothetical protein [Candidatus Methanoperedens sp.]
MRRIKEKIYDHLYACQQQFGGYTGKDIEEIARHLGFNRKTIKRDLEKWTTTDPLFAELKYIGKRSIPITLEDIAVLNQLLSENITIRRQEIMREMNEKRIKRGESPIPQSTLYNIINNLIQTLTNGAPQEHYWLVTQGIEVSDMYNLADARTMLSNTFIYSGLKIFGGIDIDGIALRLQEAQKWFEETYPNVDPFKWFFRIRPRSKVIRNHLSKIHADESLSNQARLVFEAQADFIVRLKDILIDELIHKEGWIQCSVDANRQKIENSIRTEWINKYYETANKVIINPNEDNLSTLKNLVDEGMPESEEAELEFLEKHRMKYEHIYRHLEELTNNFSEDRIIPHHATAQLLLDLCSGKCKWAFLNEEEKKKMITNSIIQKKEQFLKAVLTKKLISYIRKGKITLAQSFKYQDISKIIESVELSDTDWIITKEDIEKLIEGTYPIDLETNISDISQVSCLDEDVEFEYQPYNKIPFQQVQNQVSGVVADHNPLWFQSHQEIFEKMTDGMFEMEYDELTFRTKLYEAIGFLGRNLRYSDSPSFQGLRYFIQRYLSDATLDLEFRHLWKLYEDLTGHKTPLIIIDSIGIDSRRKSLFAKIHGRYYTIGFIDVRAVSPYLIPMFSSNYRSTDSEAMNIIEIVNQAKSVLGEEFKFCTGNSHTISRIAAGLAFADHKVILLGRNPNPPKKPGKRCLSRLLKHLDLINKVGKLVREDSEFGRIIATRGHIYVNGVNVRNLLRDLGKLILWNSEQKGYDLDALIQLVETSNRQKRLVRIVERGVTRVNGSLKWEGWSPIKMENIALFIPA